MITIAPPEATKFLIESEMQSKRYKQKKEVDTDFNEIFQEELRKLNVLSIKAMDILKGENYEEARR